MANSNNNGQGTPGVSPGQSQPINKELLESQFYGTVQTFTGSQCLAYALIPPDFEAARRQGRFLQFQNPEGPINANPKIFWGTAPYVLGTLSTLSYNSHRPAFPVIRKIRPVAYTNGPRTIGGTLIFNVFDASVLVELYRNYYGERINPHHENISQKGHGGPSYGTTQDGSGANSNAFARPSIGRSDVIQVLKNGGIKLFAELADELPPIDIHLLAVNESGHHSYMALHNMKFIDESMTLSIDEIYTEQIIQFVSSSITPLQTENRIIDSRDRLFNSDQPLTYDPAEFEDPPPSNVVPNSSPPT